MEHQDNEDWLDKGLASVLQLRLASSDARFFPVFEAFAIVLPNSLEIVKCICHFRGHTSL